MVSLLIQYPINLLRGEVVSTQVIDSSIQPSNCSVTSCHHDTFRSDWFIGNTGSPIGIGYLSSINVWLSQKSQEDLDKRCAGTGFATSAMTSRTKLHILLQYFPICNDPELMKLQHAHLDKELLYEILTAPGQMRAKRSLPIEAFCSTSVSRGVHVFLEKHIRLTRRISEQDLLRHQYVKTALHFRSPEELSFWRNGSEGVEASRLRLYKKRIVETSIEFKSRYKEFRMYKDTTDFEALGLTHLRMIFVALASVFFMIIANHAVLKYCTPLCSDLLEIFNYDEDETEETVNGQHPYAAQ